MSLWHIYHIRKRTPFYVSVYSQGIAHGKVNVLGFDYHIKFWHINGQVTQRESDFQRQRRIVQARLKNDPKFLLKIMHWSDAKHQQVLSLSRTIKRLRMGSVSNTALAQWLTRYVRGLGEFWTIGVVPLYVEQDLTDAIQRFVEERLSPDAAARAMQVFMTPLKEGIVGEEHRELLRVAMKTGAARTKAIEHHAERYAWMANQLFTHSFFPPSYYRKRLARLTPAKARTELTAYRKQQRGHRRAFCTLIARLRPDRRMRIMIESLNEAIFWRSWRGEKPYETQYEIRHFFEEIARRCGLSAKDLLFCVPSEIVAWLRTGRAVAQSVIEARKKGFIYLTEKRDRVLTGPHVRAWERRVAATLPKVSVVKGATAFPGNVRGPARIVRGAAELGKVRHGDVLITPSTTPLFMPVIPKVVAIVTEEGGVLSHASVISRELKIPCVIGTKIATRVFRDGDVVNVDAEKGVVQKVG